MESLTSKVQWRTTSDTDWKDDNYIEFTVKADEVWHRYANIDFRSAYGWVGNICNFRFFPFIDGYPYIKIYIRRMAFVSPNYFKCLEPACRYHNSFSHPCPGKGSFAYAESLIPKAHFPLDDNHKRIGVNFDNRGAYYFDIDVSGNIDGHVIAASITRKLSSFEIGGYLLAECLYDDNAQTFRIYTGTRGSSGSVEVIPGDYHDASALLGFYDDDGNSKYKTIVGYDPEDLFKERFRRIPPLYLYQLINSETPVIHYETDLPLVEIGRREALTISTDVMYYEGLALGLLMIDFLAKANYYGYISKVFMAGKIIYGTSYCVWLRPKSGKQYEVKGISKWLQTTSVNAEQTASLTKNKFIALVDWYLEPGDVLGIYQAAPAIGKTSLGGSSTFYEEEYRGAWIEVILNDTNLYVGRNITYETSDVKIYGYETLPIYASSEETIHDMGFEIELRSEFGIDSIAVVGQESADIISFNLARMNGINVEVRSKGDTTVWLHKMRPFGDPVTRKGEPHNIDCLTDGVTSAIGGSSSFNLSEGSGYGSYFYLSSDLEWVPLIAFSEGKEFIDDNINMPDRMGGDIVDWGLGVGVFNRDYIIPSDWDILEQRDRVEMWIEFWFSGTPGIKFDVDSIIMYFVEEFNLRDFCLEKYLEVGERDGYSWTTQNPWPIKALGFTPETTGTQFGWAFLDAPTMIMIDGRYDVTGNNYLKRTYTTDWVDDYWPNLTDSECTDRWLISQATYWTSLSYTYNSFKTRAVRLYCWRHYSTKITEIRIMSKLWNVKALSNAIVAKAGLVGSLFHSSTYELTTASGEIYKSSILTEDTNAEDWNYLDLEPLSMTSGVVTCPLGFTANKFDFEISGLDVDISSIWISPQDKSIRLEDHKNDPITEVNNLEAKLSPSISGQIASPVRTIKIYNDTGIEADLEVNLAHTAGFSAIVYDCDLANQQSIDNPTTGAPPNLSIDSDFDMTNMNSIAWNSNVYALDPIDNSELTWYGRRTGGIWIDSRWNNPFEECAPIYWNEPRNTFISDWRVYNAYKANKIDINSTSPGNLYFDLPMISGTGQWIYPTYFTDVGRDDHAEIRVRLDSELPHEYGVDIEAGLVLFDNADKNNYIIISRYSGDDYIVSYGDYIVYGMNGSDSLTTTPDDIIYLKIIKEGLHIRVGYRDQFNALTIIDNFYISSWSDDLRIGVFALIENTDSAGYEGNIFEIPWMDYETTTRPDYVDHFDTYSWSISSDVSCDNWTLTNASNSPLFYSPDSTSLYMTGISGTLFVASGSTATQLSIPICEAKGEFTIEGKFDNIITSTSGHMGFIIKHPSNPSNYASFLIKEDEIESKIYSGQLYTNTYPLYYSPSTIWLQASLNKDSRISFQYSFDGSTWTGLSAAVSVWDDWGAGILELSIGIGDEASVNINDLFFSIQRPIPTGANEVAIKLPMALPIVDVYGRGSFSIMGWALSDATTASGVIWSEGKPYYSNWIKFGIGSSLDSEEALNENIKIFPDPTISKNLGYDVTYTQLNKDKIWKYCKGLNYENYTPYYESSYPILMIDLENNFYINRIKKYNFFKEDSSRYGKFATTETSDPLSVNWEPVFRSDYGFYRKWRYSTNNTCGAPLDWGKPSFDYKYYPRPADTRAAELNGLGAEPPATQRYYSFWPGGCNGIFTVSKMFETCHIFNLGRFRWWMIKSTNTTIYDDFEDTWKLGPLLSHPIEPLPLTSYSKWWGADYGDVSVNNENNIKSLKYSYEGHYLEAFYINYEGCPYCRLTFDENWTTEDYFQFDIKVEDPSAISWIGIRLGRDDKRYYQFEITDFYKDWHTYKLKYKEAFLFVDVQQRGDQRLAGEPFIDESDDIYYRMSGYVGYPLMFFNFGYIVIYINGTSTTNIYFKNFKNNRAVFETLSDGESSIYLGNNSFLEIPSLPILTLHGTIEFDYLLPSAKLEGMMDPRSVNYSVFLLTSVSKQGYALWYDTAYGWVIAILSDG